MQIQDNQSVYGALTRLLHWVMVVFFIMMFSSALAWDGENFQIMMFHKSVGLMVFFLVLVRLAWSAKNFKNRPPMSPIAKLGHLALYALMFIVPLVAILREYGRAKAPLQIFGVPVMSAADEKIDFLVQLGHQVHGELAWFFGALILGHIAMVFVHHIKGDKIIKRMAGKQ